MIHIITFRAMGCQVSVQLEADKRGTALLQDMPQRFAHIEATLTRFNPSSELMRFNARAGERVIVSDLLLANIQSAKHAALLTDGLYNPLVLPSLVATGYTRSFQQIDAPQVDSVQPTPHWREIDINLQTHEVRIPFGAAVDLGGIAKGWTAEFIAEELAATGSCLVNIGGDLVGRGKPQNCPGWQVEVEDPLTGEAFITLYLHDQAISTSGIHYRRWQDADGSEHHHIIDPRTGDTALTDVLSATVIHRSATIAEAYAKALILQGAAQGMAWLQQQWHTDGILFRDDGAVLATSTLTYERNLSS